MQVVKAGATDVTVTIRIIDSGDGTPETGVTSASSGIDLWYRNGATAAKTSITEADLSALTDAHSDGGMLHIDDGYYRLDLPDAAVPAAGAVTVVGGGVTGMIVLGTAIQAAPSVNVYSISDDATAADNCELMFDGTGYAGGTTKLGVDAVALSGDTSAADNAEAFFDGTGYAGTNNVIPLVTTTTTATNVTTVNGLAANVITAASIAADAIGASELAADAVAEIADAVWDEAIAGHVSAGTFGEQCGTDIDAILVDTAEIGAAGAGLTVLATQASVDVIDGIVDDILVDTGTTLQAELDGIQADTEDIQSRIPAALASGNIKADVLAINGSTSAAARLALSAANMIPGTVDTTAFTATTTILESDDITEATADHYNGRLILFTSGALLGQVTDVTDYELNGGRGRFTYTATTEAPANDTTFILV